MNYGKNMKQVINCLKENNPVINKKLKEVTIDEGLEIATILFETLNKRQDGIGLAANQVGIDAAVAVVNVRKPIILINPKVVEQWDEIDFYEGCLSYPKKGVNTKRYKNIIIKTEQEESNLYLVGQKILQMEKVVGKKNNKIKKIQNYEHLKQYVFNTK